MIFSREPGVCGVVGSRDTPGRRATENVMFSADSAFPAGVFAAYAAPPDNGLGARGRRTRGDPDRARHRHCGTHPRQVSMPRAEPPCLSIHTAPPVACITWLAHVPRCGQSIQITVSIPHAMHAWIAWCIDREQERETHRARILRMWHVRISNVVVAVSRGAEHTAHANLNACVGHWP